MAIKGSLGISRRSQKVSAFYFEPLFLPLRYHRTLFRFSYPLRVLSRCIVCNNCNLTKQCEDRILMNTHCHYVGQDIEQRTYTIEIWASEYILCLEPTLFRVKLQYIIQMKVTFQFQNNIYSYNTQISTLY